MTETVEIKGYCDPRFTAVKEAFRKNFESGLEMGASFAATIDGKFVVDIWAGYADAAGTCPWEQDTITNVYSTTKVMISICALILIDRGQLDPGAPVAKYWPEFAQNGKENIPVSYLLSHQAGLACINEPIPPEALYDWNRIIGLLEKQKPAWEPGKHSGYHVYTFGFLVGELIRRISGKTPRTFFREEVAEPLKADFHIGLPAEDDYRVAELIPPPVLKPGNPGYVKMDPESLTWKAWTNPMLNPAITRERAWRDAEIPAVNGYGNARSVARIAAVVACGGGLEGVRLIGMPTIEKAITEQISGIDLIMGLPLRFGLGFGLNSKEKLLGPNPRTCFWGGLGGSSMVMDLDAGISWGYVMNKMAPGLMDMRGVSIARYLYAAL
ncbi:MAG: beta-lactamase family protein [Dehalococcoidales bacterium]|nr:beta-lactamase family protein [Dehalococcoidales bacterium]